MLHPVAEVFFFLDFRPGSPTRLTDPRVGRGQSGSVPVENPDLMPSGLIYIDGQQLTDFKFHRELIICLHPNEL